jgi:hypothetical protein
MLGHDPTTDRGGQLAASLRVAHDVVLAALQLCVELLGAPTARRDLDPGRAVALLLPQSDELGALLGAEHALAAAPASSATARVTCSGSSTFAWSVVAEAGIASSTSTETGTRRTRCQSAAGRSLSAGVVMSGIIPTT